MDHLILLAVYVVLLVGSITIQYKQRKRKFNEDKRRYARKR